MRSIYPKAPDSTEFMGIDTIEGDDRNVHRYLDVKFYPNAIVMTTQSGIDVDPDVVVLSPDMLCCLLEKYGELFLPEPVKQEKPKEEPLCFLVTLIAPGTNRIQAIKEIKVHIGCDLKHAKDLVELAPSLLLRTPDKQKADDLTKALENIGCAVGCVYEGDPVITEDPPEAFVEMKSHPDASLLFDVVITDVGPNEYQVITKLMDITGQSFAFCQTAVSVLRSLPFNIYGLTAEPAVKLADEFKKLGASASIEYHEPPVESEQPSSAVPGLVYQCVECGSFGFCTCSHVPEAIASLEDSATQKSWPDFSIRQVLDNAAIDRFFGRRPNGQG